MIEYVVFSCPKCDMRRKTPSKNFDKQVKCSCGKMFYIGSAKDIAFEQDEPRPNNNAPIDLLPIPSNSHEKREDIPPSRWDKEATQTDSLQVEHSFCNKQVEHFGIGCFLQAISFQLIFFIPLYFFGDFTEGLLTDVIISFDIIAMAFVLFAYGSKKRNIYRCGNCGNRLESKYVKICAICKAVLS